MKIDDPSRENRKFLLKKPKNTIFFQISTMYFCLRGIYYKHDQKYKGGIMRKTVLQGALGEALMRTVNERLKKS
ncbi:MAG: hypothetical protein J6W00_08900 [Lentisphaeria bacterium]|nr:hypothetical protein [Lentisphaeria bacterium]